MSILALQEALCLRFFLFLATLWSVPRPSCLPRYIRRVHTDRSIDPKWFAYQSAFDTATRGRATYSF